MTDLTATPATGAVDAPASMDSILAEFEAGDAVPAEATEAAVQELVEEAEEGQSEEEAATEEDATDADDTGEETAEEEPEEGEDEPEPTYKVKVAGEEVEVPLSELVKGYSRERDYTQKTMAVAEERKQLQSQFASELEKHVVAFEALDPILSETRNFTPEIWQRLSQDDPTTYVQLKAAHDQRVAQVTEARKKIEEARAPDPEETAKVAQAETQALISKAKEAGLADLSDPAEMSAFATNAVNYLRGTGFEDSEIRDLTDHRALVIIEKARRYDEVQKAKASLPAKKVVQKSAVKPLKSDGSQSSAPKPRIPGPSAPREKRLAAVVDQFFQE